MARIVLTLPDQLLDEVVAALTTAGLVEPPPLADANAPPSNVLRLLLRRQLATRRSALAEGRARADAVASVEADLGPI